MSLATLALHRLRITTCSRADKLSSNSLYLVILAADRRIAQRGKRIAMLQKLTVPCPHIFQMLQ